MRNEQSKSFKIWNLVNYIAFSRNWVVFHVRSKRLTISHLNSICERITFFHQRITQCYVFDVSFIIPSISIIRTCSIDDLKKWIEKWITSSNTSIYLNYKSFHFIASKKYPSSKRCQSTHSNASKILRITKRDRPKNHAKNTSSRG